LFYDDFLFLYQYSCYFLILYLILEANANSYYTDQIRSFERPLLSLKELDLIAVKDV